MRKGGRCGSRTRCSSSGSSCSSGSSSGSGSSSTTTTRRRSASTCLWYLGVASSTTPHVPVGLLPFHPTSFHVYRLRAGDARLTPSARWPAPPSTSVSPSPFALHAPRSGSCVRCGGRTEVRPPIPTHTGGVETGDRDLRLRPLCPLLAVLEHFASIVQVSKSRLLVCGSGLTVAVGAPCQRLTEAEHGGCPLYWMGCLRADGESLLKVPHGLVPLPLLGKHHPCVVPRLSPRGRHAPACSDNQRVLVVLERVIKTRRAELAARLAPAAALLARRVGAAR